jgi:hypothetical protein
MAAMTAPETNLLQHNGLVSSPHQSQNIVLSGPEVFNLTSKKNLMFTQFAFIFGSIQNEAFPTLLITFPQRFPAVLMIFPIVCAGLSTVHERWRR